MDIVIIVFFLALLSLCTIAFLVNKKNTKHKNSSINKTVTTRKIHGSPRRAK